jgi:hypothetical protein
MFAAAALSIVTAVHPGMTLVQDATSAMVISDLCAPGVAVRATRYNERQATPQQWGQSVGVQAAINADFFDFPGWSYVLVRARGAGEEWPAYAELLEQPSAYWQFGPGVVGIQTNSLVTPANDITEVVGAYDPIIGFGGVVDQNGDPFMQEFHRRSGIGISWDAATLYMYASNAPIDGAGMANEMIALAAEAGAPAIAFATNQDGGGSSQLYVDGMGQVIDSGRQVNDHLGVYASGSGPAPNCPNKPPKGYLDGVACDAFAGWAQDPDVPTQSIDVQFFFDGQGPLDVMANVTRSDLCGPLGSCDHAFTPPPPFGMLDGKPHVVNAYAIDSKNGNKTALAQSPQTMTCPAPKLSGYVRRHVVDLPSFVAWKLLVLDVLSIDDASFSSVKKTSDIPATPELIRSDDGAPEVWIVDGPEKRHVIDPQSAAAWRFDLGSTKVLPAAQVKAMTTGLPWPARPLMIKGTGAEIDLLDTDPNGSSSNGRGDGGVGDSEDGTTGGGGGCNTTGARGDTWLYFVLALAILARRHSSGVVFVQRLKALAKARPSE